METDSKHLSTSAQSLWGKLSNDGSHYWLPLWVHLRDTGEIAKLLWDSWLPKHTKQIIADGIQEVPASCENAVQYAKQIAVFMALAHDIGKASPAFQKKSILVQFRDVWDTIYAKGFADTSFNSALAREFPHALIGQRILEEQGLDCSFAVVVGGHHGKPPKDVTILKSAKTNSVISGMGERGWEDAQQELVQFALYYAELLEMPSGTFSVQAQILLTGFLIMADWIASGDGFPLISYEEVYRPIYYDVQRAQKAYEQLQLPRFGEFSDACSADALFHTRFAIDTPRPIQLDAMQAVLENDHSGMYVIEAPMGEGKTEAALAAAEILARKYKLSGVYFALPTQATSDGIFKRIETWIENLHQEKRTSIFLAHGKSGFNEDYAGIKLHSNLFTYEDIDNGNTMREATQEAVVVNDWTQGRKKGLLSDFVVGTIDQILMCGLRQKHLALRHLGVANKVVIIDECHAYDTYMSSYLDLVLSWLGAYHIPVIVLSATLPPTRRSELIQAYSEVYYSEQKRKRKREKASSTSQQPEKMIIAKDEIVLEDTSAYPLISYTDGTEIKEIASQPSGRKLRVQVELFDEENLVNTLQSLLSDGGCVGIIRNTVQKAQETAKLLETFFGRDTVRLLHSRFISCDRVRKETEVRYLLGPGEEQRPKTLIVVGTQVMEQSLDVDFDILFTDICPIDLLLQRTGRLQRHTRHVPRPAKFSEATCFVMGIAGETEFEQGSEAVYGAYLLLKTKAFLPEEILLPDDIPILVQQVYAKDNDETMINRLGCAQNNITITQCCHRAKEKYQTVIKDKKEKSKAFQIKKPTAQCKRSNLIGWLNAGRKEDKTGKRGEATVRDTNPSIEAVVIVQKQDGYLYTLPWLNEHGDERIEGIPNDELAKIIAGCSVSLPAYFTGNWIIDDVIAELETIALDHGLEKWYESYWLDGELFLVLNEAHEMLLLDKVIQYDERYGLDILEREV